MGSGPKLGGSQAPASTRLDPGHYRRVIGGFATGITVVTAVDGAGRCFGMTANSLTSVSLDPILLLVCFGHESTTLTAALESGLFVVNLLDEKQQESSVRFSRPSDDPFAGLDYTLTEQGVPILTGGLGYLECRVDGVSTAGDHQIVIGRVERCTGREGRPLLYFRGHYERIAAEITVGALAGDSGQESS